jgi:tRNA1Val (adenine37-N6)-methyltransferase
MANSYFRFKQFLIEQDKSAMKVTTDACLFGSLFSTLLPSEDGKTQVLDIGTGTGLLTLMYAQQFPSANIDAVEVDEHAFTQASENISASPWSQRIHAIHADISQYQPNKKYDVIICNPPFYEKDLRSTDAQRNKALHDSHLTLSTLFESVSALLESHTVFLILLPFHRSEHCINIASQYGLFCSNHIQVKQTEKHNYFRSIMKFSRTEKATDVKEIIIKINEHYSSEFAQLLSPFYLAL